MVARARVDLTCSAKPSDTTGRTDGQGIRLRFGRTPPAFGGSSPRSGRGWEGGGGAETEARRAVREAREATGLPVTDPIRFGPGPLADAVERAMG